MVLKVLQNKNIQDVRTLRSMTKPFIKGPVNDSNFCKKSNEASTDNLKAKSDTGLGVRYKHFIVCLMIILRQFISAQFYPTYINK